MDWATLRVYDRSTETDRRELRPRDADGEAKGRADGEAKGKAELLLRQLSFRFGAISDATREKVLGAKPERLDLWAERALTGASIEEILG